MIKWRLMPNGGFVCGDTATEVAAYAYPSSPNAETARRQPKMVAVAMLHGVTFCPELADVYARFWLLLNMGQRQSGSFTP